MKIASLIICAGIALLASCGMSPEEKKAKAEELKIDAEKRMQVIFTEAMAKGMRGVDIENDSDLKKKAEKVKDLFDEINELDPTMRERFEYLDNYLKKEKGL